MDTSKQYIKMCEKAGEIQDWFFESERERFEQKWFFEYDFFACKEHQVLMRTNGPGGTWRCPAVEGSLCVRKGKFSESGNMIWLPRQDQLQEIYYPIAESIFNKLDSVGYKYPMDIRCVAYSVEKMATFESEEASQQRFYHSWEQLWLAFVMKEKYGKILNGKKEGWGKVKMEKEEACGKEVTFAR